MRAIRLLAVVLASSSWSIAHARKDDCQSGHTALQTKNYSLAVSRLNKCLSLDLTDKRRATMLMVRAQAYAGLKQLEFAIEDQEEAIALIKSRDAWPWIGLAIFRREMKQYDKALAAIKEAEKRDEDGPGTGPGMATFYHKGWTLHEAGRYSDAIKAYTRGIPRQPDYGWALYRRAMAYEALGDRVQAKRDLFRVAELNPKDGYEAHIVAKLREYGFNAKVRKE
jgi:tetratricopeptide (TPR) repeat protein